MAISNIGRKGKTSFTKVTEKVAILPKHIYE
jgi:hypothetical protein